MHINSEQAIALQKMGIQAHIGACIQGRGVLSAACLLHPGSRIVSCNLGAYSYIVGGTELQLCSIGNYTSIAHRSTLLLGHPTERITTSPVGYGGTFAPFPGQQPIPPFLRTSIGSDVWIGACVCIKAGVSIGHGAVIGGGAVVSRDIPAYAIAVGVPARVIRYRFPEAMQARLLRSRWFEYDWSTHTIPWASAEDSLTCMEAHIARGTAKPFESHYEYEAAEDIMTLKKLGQAEVKAP